MKRVAIFASGSGTNAEAIIQSQKAGQLPCEVALLITDKPGAKVVERVKVHEIPVCALDPKTYPSKEAYEIEVVQLLKEKQIDFVVLAGYMRLVGPTLLGAYEGRIVNIHPSLLPAFPGLHAIEQAIRANVKVTGVTIHYVDEGMDTGPIIAQEPVSIEEEDTLETLTTKIQAVEHRLYPATLHKLLSK